MKVPLRQVLVHPDDREALVAREQLRALVEARAASDELLYWPMLAEAVEALLEGPAGELPHRLAVLIDAGATVLGTAAQVHGIGLETDPANAAEFLFTITERAIQELGSELKGAPA